MFKKEKLIESLRNIPSDFRYNGLVKLLSQFGFKEIKKGKTSGSRVKFVNKKNVPICFHKPYPSGIIKRYQLKQIKEILGI